MFFFICKLRHLVGPAGGEKVDFFGFRLFFFCFLCSIPHAAGRFSCFSMVLYRICLPFGRLALLIYLSINILGQGSPRASRHTEPRSGNPLPASHRVPATPFRLASFQSQLNNFGNKRADTVIPHDFNENP